MDFGVEELLTVPEAAALIRVSEETVRRRIRSGALLVAAGGPRSQRIRRSDLIAEHATPHARPPGKSRTDIEGTSAVAIDYETSQRLDAQAKTMGLDRDVLANKLLGDALADFKEAVAGIRRGEAAGAAGHELDFETYVQRDRNGRARRAQDVADDIAAKTVSAAS